LLKKTVRAVRDNREMSEGLEKSRSNKLGDGLVQMHNSDSKSQKEFGELKNQLKNNVTLDSG